MLVQYDCGKLQLLAKLLHQLKREGHRVLIFTQMTKMLNILEVFLNIHGFLYFRLDGATKVDDRQRMMERYNRDPKIFAFILSTRSGGLGINLVGADTVIFYDSDWNPSMDAQAQDRAHRIGQTREVHIYRLISEHTIEENILLKANQKRHLNKLSVEDGNFTVSSMFESVSNSLLGDSAKPPGWTEEEISQAMLAAEDESDKLAAKRATREAKAELAEFDESVPLKEAQQQQLSTGSKKVQTASKSEAPEDSVSNPEASNAALTQAQFKELESQLRPIDRYAIEFRTSWCPIVDTQKQMEGLQKIEESQKEDWELEKLEREKEIMENEAEDELITAIEGSCAIKPEDYQAAKKNLARNRKIRKLTGSAWNERYEDGNGNKKRKYYFNVDTREISWDRPSILDAYANQQIARERGWGHVPENVLVRIFSFLIPTERHVAACTCVKWKASSLNLSLCIWVICPQRVFNAKELITVGTPVQCLYQKGEVWYPGVVSNVHGNGNYRITYTDGAMEFNVPRCYLRRDTGVRFTVINPPPEEDSPPIKVLSKHHCSSFGCGIPPPEPPQVTSLAGAFSRAHPGETIVLTAGFHDSDTAFLPPFPVRLVGEKRLCKELKLFAYAAGKMWNDQLLSKKKEANQSGMENATINTNQRNRSEIELKRKLSGMNLVVKKPKVHPLHDITVVGVEADILPSVLPVDSMPKPLSCVSSKRNPSPYEQASVLFLRNGPLVVDNGYGKTIIEGIAFVRGVKRDDARPAEKQIPHCLRIARADEVSVSQCTFDSLIGDGACIAVEQAESTLSLRNSLVCNSKRSGIMLLDGKLVCFEVEICSNGNAGIIAFSGSLICRLCYIHGNIGPGIGVKAPNGFFNAKIHGNILTGNSAGLTQSLYQHSAVDLVLSNNVLNDEDIFENDPYHVVYNSKKRPLNPNDGPTQRKRRSAKSSKDKN